MEKGWYNPVPKGLLIERPNARIFLYLEITHRSPNATNILYLGVLCQRPKTHIYVG